MAASGGERGESEKECSRPCNLRTSSIVRASTRKELEGREPTAASSPTLQEKEAPSMRRALNRSPLFRSPVVLLAAGAVLLGALGGHWIAAAQTENRYTLGGQEVAVYNLIGQATVLPGKGPEVEVAVTIGGPDGSELKVETGEVGGRQTLRVIYPGTKFLYKELGRGSSTQFRVKDDGTFGDGLSGGRSVKISGSGSGLEAHADLTIYVPAGKTLRVHQAVGEVSASDVEGGLWIDTAAASVSAEGIRGSLGIDVGSGSVDVQGADGDVSVDTGSGNIDAGEIRATRVVLETGSGRVTGDGITTTHLAVSTGSGSIDLNGIRSEEVKMDTGSGSVSIVLDSDVESLAIDTGSGGVRVGVPSMLGAEVRVETGSGEIEIDVPHEAAKHHENFFSGRIGDGRGEIKIDTGSGGVEIVGA
jgi:hypothetical protein